MANTATPDTALRINYGMMKYNPNIIPVRINYDTSGADLTIYTPDSNKMVLLAGLQYAKNAAHTLTFKSGSTVLVTFDLAGGGFTQNVGEGLMLIGNVGEALVLSSNAALGSCIAYVYHTNEFQLDTD